MAVSAGRMLTQTLSSSQCSVSFDNFLTPSNYLEKVHDCLSLNTFLA